jgi:hypothetical protein
MLAAISLLAIVGLRYPLKMLPLLFFEISANNIDADSADTIQACLMAFIFPIVIPWCYALANFVHQSGDRWK